MEGVTRMDSGRPGKTAAVFGGVHGNERVGVDAVRQAASNLKLERGTVYVVEANPLAIAQDVRFVEKNMNRCFLENNTGSTYEDNRARELMELLKECDALLDIHASNSRSATPFVICEGNESRALAKTLDFPLITDGWDAVEPGATDGYMSRLGKLSLGIECGSVFDGGAQVHRATSSITRFLAHLGIIETAPVPAVPDQKHVHMFFCHVVEVDFSPSREFADFEPVRKGELIGTDGGKNIYAPEDALAVFVRRRDGPGQEAFLLGRQLA